MAAPDIASRQPGFADGGEQTWRLLLPQAGEAVRADDAQSAQPPAVERTGGS